jgi:apolipoprotein N-acyltransferase
MRENGVYQQRFINGVLNTTIKSKDQSHFICILKVLFTPILKAGVAIGAAFLSGILMYASFPSHNLPFLIWFALVPLLLSLTCSKPLSGFAVAFICGVVFYTGLFYWIFDLKKYTLLHHAVLGIYLCPLVGIVGSIVSYLAKRYGVATALFSAPFLWVAQEYIHANLSFLALPWGLLAHSQYKQLLMIQFTSITGTYGVSFLIVLVNSAITALLYLLLQQKIFAKLNPGRMLTLKGTAALVTSATIAVLMVIVHGYLMLSKPLQGKEMKIAIVQGNIEQAQKWDKRYAAAIMQIYSDLSYLASKDSPQLIIWPETATPRAITLDQGLYSQVMQIAQSTGTHLLIGSAQLVKFQVNKPKNYKYLNSAYLITPDLNRKNDKRYDKIRLLPFGEYIPHKEKIPWSYINVPDVGHYLPGKDYTVFSIDALRFSTTICWENIFPDLVRKFVNNGAQFIVNLTNEAWFGKSAAPYQFLSMSVFRALENSIYIVRCANTGISCFIDPCGRVIDRVRNAKGLDIFVRGALTGTISLLDDKSFYTRHGEWFAGLCLIGSVAFLLMAFWSKVKTNHRIKEPT